MTADQTADLLYTSAFLVLVVSSLAARRLPVGQMVKYALAWIAIFAGAIVLYSFRGVAQQGWEQIQRELYPSSPVSDGKTVRIRMADDGHFYVDARANGHHVRFLVDSGATTSSLSQSSASAAGVEIDTIGLPVAVETANGLTTMRRARIGVLDLGSITRQDFPVLVSGDKQNAMNLLGMNFLSSLGHWRVEGREMVLEP